jgi:hypothetical protein
MDDWIIQLLKKNLRGELYDFTFTSKKNVTGKLKSQQVGTTLTLEKAIYELLIIEETTKDDKTEKRELRKNFLIRCYHDDDLSRLFEAYTEFLNGGENTTSPFIINVSGGNLIILYAWLIMHINSAKQKVAPPLNFGTDKLKEQFEKLMSVEKIIPREIIESASLIAENGFSDLDFYIIKNLKCNEKMSITGGANTPPEASVNTPPEASVRRSKRERTPRGTTIADEQVAEVEAKRLKTDLKRKENLAKAIEEKEARKQDKAKKEEILKAQEEAKKREAIEKANKLETATKRAKKSKPRPKLKEEDKKAISEDKKVNQGFIVYRIKTGVFLQDYLDIVLQENDPNDPKEFTDLKEALLDLFIFNIENKDYNPFETDHINEADYIKLYEQDLPTTFGKDKKTQIEMYPQIFQKKYLKEGLGLSDKCVQHLNYLNYQKRILETSKNLNIFLLLICLRERYGELDYINLIKFLNELCYNINNQLQHVTIDSFDTFESLDYLKESQSVDDIINIVRYVSISHPVTECLRKKLIKLFALLPNFVKLVSSRTIIKNDPQVDDVLIYIPDKHSEHFDDNELLKIDDNVSRDEIKESVPPPPKEGGYKKKIGKKLEKSKKKRKVNKKTKNKHNKKNKRTRRKKNNKTEKKVRK